MIHNWIGVLDLRYWSNYWCNVFIQRIALNSYEMRRSLLRRYCLTQDESNCKLLTVYNQEKFNKKR